MRATAVNRVAVWPPLIRLGHWLMVVSSVVLIATGALLKSGLVLNENLFNLLLRDLHLPAGHLLAIVLIVRLGWLVIGRGVAGWRALLPGGPQIAAVREMLRFYLSLGRSPLPAYYAHNPLWGPLYLALLLMLLVAVVSGFLLEFSSLRAVFHVAQVRAFGLHHLAFAAVTILAVAHTLAAFLHDWRGTGADVSGMISGYRTFKPEEADAGKVVPSSVTGVRIEDIAKRRERKDSV